MVVLPRCINANTWLLQPYTLGRPVAMSLFLRTPNDVEVKTLIFNSWYGYSIILSLLLICLYTVFLLHGCFFVFC